MSLDPVTAAKAGSVVFRFWTKHRLGEKLFPKWAARRKENAMESWAVEHKGFSPEEVSMDQQVVTQILLGVVRHAMTATGVGVYFSDDLVVQVVSALVALGGAVWMARRKVKAAQ